jgi:hypothetical protein
MGHELALRENAVSVVAHDSSVGSGIHAWPPGLPIRVDWKLEKPRRTFLARWRVELLIIAKAVRISHYSRVRKVF